jgi:hypothetical protein
MTDEFSHLSKSATQDDITQFLILIGIPEGYADTYAEEFRKASTSVK